MVALNGRHASVLGAGGGGHFLAVMRWLMLCVLAAANGANEQRRAHSTVLVSPPNCPVSHVVLLSLLVLVTYTFSNAILLPW